MKRSFELIAASLFSLTLIRCNIQPLDLLSLCFRLYLSSDEKFQISREISYKSNRKKDFSYDCVRSLVRECLGDKQGAEEDSKVHNPLK